MKKLLCIAVASVVFAACRQSKEYPKQLVWADSIMAAHPDSALAILNAYKNSAMQMDESGRMYYTLLLTLAKDKCRLTHDADTLMPDVVEYYESKGDDKKLSWAYYTLGRIYDDIKNYPKALDYYQKAIDKGRATEDFRLMGLAYSQVGVIYHYNYMYDEMVDAYRKSYEYALRAKDTLAIAHRLTNMACVYTALNDVDSTLYYYNKSYEINHDPMTKSAIADIYIQIEEYDKAYEALCFNRKSYTYWADYYKAVGQSDSAIHYYDLTLSNGNLHAKLDAANNLAQYAETEGDLQSALEYRRKGQFLQDSINAITKVAELKRVEMQAKMEKAEKVKSELEYENHIAWITILSVLSFALISILITYRRYKLTKERAEKNMRMAVIKEANESPNDVASTDNAQPESNVDRIIGDKGRFPLLNSVINEASNKNYTLREEDWECLKREITVLYPKFINNLKLMYVSINPKELCVCCLMKLNLRQTDIAHTICMSNNGLTTLQIRLYKKLTGGNGKAKDLKELIKTL